MNSYLDIFWRFLMLGCVSFGGPAAHIGYFQRTFVSRLGWVSEAEYAQLVSLSQFLPGPGSSQVGFAIGLQRAGIPGGIAAFMGFTLPSFALMYWLAVWGMQGQAGFSGVIAGLKLLAVVVVADATLTMSRSFCKETSSVAIAVGVACIMWLFQGAWVQLFTLVLVALLGMAVRGKPREAVTTEQNASSGRFALVPLISFAALLLFLPVVAHFTADNSMFSIFNDFYQSGSLVFGGGHVVLPLLQQNLAGAMSVDQFLTGYAAAQGMPGPMFSIATFLGAAIVPETPLAGALIATSAIFLPGFLLLVGLSGKWRQLAAQPRVSGAIWAINAAVVGLLLSALYQPVFVNAVTSTPAIALVVTGFFALNRLRIPIVVLVIAFAIIGPVLL